VRFQLSQKRKQYDKQLKAKIALEALKEQMTTAEIARKYDVNSALVSKWRKHALESFCDIFEDQRTKEAKSKQQTDVVDEHLRQIGRLTVENEFLKKKSTEFNF